MAVGKLHLLLASHLPLSGGGDNLKVRALGLDAHIEAHMVVAIGGGSAIDLATH
jgi:hypothetical protein